MRRFGALTDDVERRRKDIDTYTGFGWYSYYGTTLRATITGMLLQFLALANGDLSKVKIETPAWRPYIRISLNGVYSDGVDNQLDAVQGYLESVPEVAEEKLPKLMIEVNEALARLPVIQEKA